MKKFFLLLVLQIIFSNQCFAQDNDELIKLDGGSVSFDYKKQSNEFWEKHLKGETLSVCRHHGTEKSASGKYDKFYKKGTYYCACCGGDHALYKSEAKFDSGSGWPSFYEPIEGSIIVRKDPNDLLRGSIGLARNEVVCSRCESHIGHVFDDGPSPTGKRYCMNSAALEFVESNKQPVRTYNIIE